MPKKTRKEKIIARLRRKLETTKTKDQTWEVESGKLDQEMGKINISKVQNIPLQSPALQFSSLTSNYMMKDLRKTFFLAGLAISLEIMLYWLWR